MCILCQTVVTVCGRSEINVATVRRDKQVVFTVNRDSRSLADVHFRLSNCTFRRFLNDKRQDANEELSFRRITAGNNLTL